MGVRDDLEWCLLGAQLSRLCPTKFTEILDTLRETVGVHEILASDARMMRTGPPLRLVAEKS